MNCYDCARGNGNAAAVAICRSCGAALCDQHARGPRPGRRPEHPAGAGAPHCVHGLPRGDPAGLSPEHRVVSPERGLCAVS
ncbi:DUF2180 family protein [Streptomyces sp. NPDC048516]|uniref:DUF2180 family protein n=1 Tax=Streptomyces sp. NPDC048516 TaxID=3365565 RepID=UPI003714826F